MPRPLLLVLPLALAGCQASGPLAPLDDVSAKAVAGVVVEAEATRLTVVDAAPDDEAPMYDGLTGEPVTAADLQRRLGDADVIVLGELHGDALAGPIEARIAAAALPSRDGGALTLEALERGTPPAQSLANWPEDGSAYKTTIGIANRAGVPVVAVNAPREIAAQAREKGLYSLRDAPGEGRLYVLPTSDDRRALVDYRERFLETFEQLQTAHGGPTTRPGSRVADYYDAQLVWDATMADGIARAVRAHGTPVVHVVGGFHSDFGGGVPRLLARRNLRVLTISILPADAERLREEDVGRADVVIYTGPLRALVPPTTTRPATTRPTTTSRPAAVTTTRPAELEI